MEQVNDGVVTVSQPGIYFIYAQINYVDSQDVNAFQILVNDSEWLMCTTMTHTPGHTTKVNTCYTGGVRFLEAGDRVMVRNTDNDRYYNAVLEKKAINVLSQVCCHAAIPFILWNRTDVTNGKLGQENYTKTNET